MVIEILKDYPFLLALIGSLVIELSAILVRRAAQVLGGWLWILAGVLSTAGIVTLLWSFLWANTIEPLVYPHDSLINIIIGPFLILSGIVILVRSVLILGRQAFLPWPRTHLVVHAPYHARRRPMMVGMAMLAIGVSITTMQIQGWIWFGVWFLLAQPLAELEEWELRSRLPAAADYLARTPRYFKFPGL
jgi:hypothetical protein